MNDIEMQIAIQRLINKYCQYFDSGDSDGLASLWVVDGVLKIAGADSIVSRAAIARWVETMSSPGGFAHLVTNIIVDRIGADECAAQSYVLGFRPSEGGIAGMTPTAIGRYDDLFELNDGTWLFRKRTVTFAGQLSSASR